ncbi:MAG: ABC transporter ATP-binding protein [Lachnospiraceae bacterium]|nr:ABC transporter ATP-binding protein [Lachnospiraceae bacterium]
MEYAIEVNGLTKHYKDFTLDNVSFQVPSGSIVGFIGENGAGKSTTIKAILDLIQADSGSIRILGKENGMRERELKEQIGVVFDESYFPDNLNIKNVDTMMRQIFRQWESGVFRDYCKRFELAEGKPVKDFSRGMKMKLSIAVALSHHTKLLILDEATSGLDPIVRNEILDIFLEFIQEEDHTIFLSSHITSDIEKISDYILLIHKGKLLFFENKDTLIYDYGLIRCGEEDFARLDSSFVLGMQKNRFEVEALVKNRRELENQYPNLVIDRVSIEDILLYTVKGMEAREL